MKVKANFFLIQAVIIVLFLRSCESGAEFRENLNAKWKKFLVDIYDEEYWFNFYLFLHFQLFSLGVV
uniref:Uncharacterized protein n=1 Tax=Trichobilharzia regenti TaxID=157069 RepID=A0AA85J2I2_TRIRE|nr:unnamed protein product [Trichobilharzia regenti]